MAVRTPLTLLAIAVFGAACFVPVAEPPDAGTPDAGPDGGGGCGCTGAACCSPACSAATVCIDCSCISDASCPSGQTLCAAGVCANLLTDNSNCGTCGHACPTGGFCQAGGCTTLNSCDPPCPSQQVCIKAVCVPGGNPCNAPQVACQSGSGPYCADLQTDNANCGLCGAACHSDQVCDDGVCQGGAPTECLTFTLVDLATRSTVIAGAQVNALDVNGNVLGTTQSTADGGVSVCESPNKEFGVSIAAQNYPLTYLENVTLTTAQNVGSLPMISTSYLSSASLFITGFDGTQGAVLGDVRSFDGGCSALSGWTFAASLPDGGKLAYQSIYLSANDLPNPSLTATSSAGLAVLYNIDPAATDVVVVTASNSAGGSCGTSINGAVGLTGRLRIAGGAASYAPVLVP